MTILGTQVIHEKSVRLIVAGLRDSITAAQYKKLLERQPATPRGSADKDKWDLTHSVENGEWKSFVFTKIA